MSDVTGEDQIKMEDLVNDRRPREKWASGTSWEWGGMTTLLMVP